MKKKLYACWFYFVFVLSCLWVKTILDDESDDMDDMEKLKIFHYISKKWMRRFWWWTGIDVAVKGHELFPEHGPCVVVLNHRSFLDIQVATSQLPIANKTIAKKEFKDYPLLGKISAIGSVFVDRSTRLSRVQAYKEMQTVLKRGITVIFFPEETRNTGPGLLPFQTGAFRLSHEMNVPLMVGVIRGSGETLPKGFAFTPGHVELEFITMLQPTDYASYEALSQAAQAIMTEALREK